MARTWGCILSALLLQGVNATFPDGQVFSAANMTTYLQGMCSGLAPSAAAVHCTCCSGSVYVHCVVQVALWFRCLGTCACAAQASASI